MNTIWWVRRDMRLHDNVALYEASRRGTPVPVFVLDKQVLGSRYHRNAQRRINFMLDGLHILAADLRAVGSRLIVREGRAEDVLTSVAAEVQAMEVFATADVTPFSRLQEVQVGRRVALSVFPGIGIRPSGAVSKPDGSGYAVFGAFRRTWLSTPLPEPIAAPTRLAAVPEDILGIDVVSAPVFGFPAGEAEALRRLDQFTLERIDGYSEGRNRPDRDFTSALSPYLKFGMLSPRMAAARTVEHDLNEERDGASRWLDELLWREFYMDVVYRQPRVLREEFNPRLRGIQWVNATDDVEAWKAGRTGYPFVDAGMRQLLHTGWMHNRARMVTASFLVKNLLCDWRIGEQWFMDQLLDGDPPSNNGGWQWSAGTGTDAAPYFRVFNPVVQGQRFDPTGEYVRRWVPELAGVSGRGIHEPWKLSAESRVGYPLPIVDIAESRRRMMAAYAKARSR
ncbi:MAG: deoxyribodipyrimidine photo-lyase [Acidobacteria bacterium]|nr:deoxyribodipyrimidine photo-lyase [Acidobacteriota bacterium]